MADYIVCPFFRKMYEDAILCEMCETWFPSTRGMKKKIKQHCVSDWHSCPRAREMESIYEAGEEMYQIRKLEFELKTAKEEVQKMKSFLRSKRQMIQDLEKEINRLNGIIKGNVDRISVLEKRERMEPEEIDRKKLRETNLYLRKVNKAQEMHFEDRVAALGNIFAYLCSIYDIKKIPIKSVADFGGKKKVTFKYPENMGELAEKGFSEEDSFEIIIEDRVEDEAPAKADE